MRTFVIFAIALVVLAIVEAVPMDGADHKRLVSELTGADVHPVTPEEMAALGYDARIRICIASQCNNICIRLGYVVGLCTTNAYCVCFR